MIPLRDQEFIRQRFAEGLQGRVRVDLFTQKPSAIFIPGREECLTCKDTQTLLEELAALSDRITLTVHEFAEERVEAKRLGIERVPGIVVRGQLNRPLKFYGIPAGNEFANFIETMVLASLPDPGVSKETVRRLKKMRHPVTATVFVTPT